jgi:hypothetical protein
MLASPAKLEVNGAQVAYLAVTDDYSGVVAPGPVTLTISSLSGGRYSYRFKAHAGKTYRFVVAPRANITGSGDRNRGTIRDRFAELNGSAPRACGV